MTAHHRSTRPTVLVSGASIAGTTLAHWLSRHGYRVTLVERADAVRAGGYPIDVRGTALEVVRRMGLLPRLREADVHLRRMTFLDGSGAQVARLAPHDLTGGDAGQDLEVRRGDLTAALHSVLPDDVELVVGDAVERVEQGAAHVDVTLRSGTRRSYDVVVGADGVHSRTRAQVFGPETDFHHYLGYCFAGLSVPNDLGLAHEVVLWNTPGRTAALYAAGETSELHTLLAFAHPDPTGAAYGDPATQRALLRDVYADAGWHVPRLLDALASADDLYVDTVSQVRMPTWSRGRVAVVGDAAYAPSFLTGQGTSLALVGAYMLADALRTHDPEAAFADYERTMRPFVLANQALVGTGDPTIVPSTAEALERRNARLRALTSAPPAEPRIAHSALELPPER